MRLKGGPSSILFPPLLSIIVPVGIQKKWESARDVQQWIFFRGRESIPKRVINALLATVRCSFTARKSDLKEHWPRNYAFLKRKSLEKKKKQRLGPVTLDFSRLFLTNRAHFYSHLSRENRLYVEISEKMERELHDVDIFLRERNVTWF